MKTNRISILTFAIIVITSISMIFSSCKKDDPMEATSIELVAGADQTGSVETALTNTIDVLVKDQDGNSFHNATVKFAVTEGAVSSATVSTNESGKASVTWTLGINVGIQTMTITAFKADVTTELSGSPITVNATATSAVTEVTDIDGNVYAIVTIGDQTWMAENMKTTKYADGTPITKIEDETDWNNLENNNIDKAYCYYDNNQNTDYGALYTYAAATNGVVYTTVDVQGVCPDGWHLPSNEEWTELIDYLGGEAVAGGKLKETGTSHWESPNTGATNSRNFAALGGGYRHYDGSFIEIKRLSMWWCSDEETAPNYGYTWYINNTEAMSTNKGDKKSLGHSVRCVLNK